MISTIHQLKQAFGLLFALLFAILGLAEQGRAEVLGYTVKTAGTDTVLTCVVVDLRLFAAIFRGEHCLHGMRNQDVRHQLFGETIDRHLRRRQANKVSRLFRRLHVHGLLAKIPRSRRWRLTERGNLLISVFQKCH